MSIPELNKLTCGPLLKGLKGDNCNSINIWGRGKGLNCYLVLRYKKSDDEKYGKIIIKRVSQENDNIGLIKINGLEDNTEYMYEMGYYNNIRNYKIFAWDNTPCYKFKKEGRLDEWSFVFGSCRRYINVGGAVLSGTGNQGDKIYKSISEKKPLFFLTIGDQVYYDPMNWFLRRKSLNSMRELNRIVLNFENIHNLFATCPVYEMCDDHDLHCNDTNWEKRTEEPEIFNNGLKVFKEYQGIDGPETGDLWYTFDRQNASFFVMDTRSERDEREVDDNGNKKIKQIISTKQINAFEQWLIDNYNKLRFVVSPTPVVSQMSEDSWFGFPEQQKHLLELIIKHDNSNILILTGDAHCARLGKYDIHEKSERQLTKIGSVIEILSSGFVAVKHDRGKHYLSNTTIDSYNNKNDFPYELDNTHRNGLKLTTTYSSNCFPIPNKPRGINKLKSITSAVTDNVYTQIIINPKHICVKIYDQKNRLLNTEKIEVAEYDYTNDFIHVIDY